MIVCRYVRQFLFHNKHECVSTFSLIHQSLCENISAWSYCSLRKLLCLTCRSSVGNSFQPLVEIVVQMFDFHLFLNSCEYPTSKNNYEKNCCGIGSRKRSFWRSQMLSMFVNPGNHKIQRVPTLVEPKPEPSHAKPISKKWGSHAVYLLSNGLQKWTDDPRKNETHFFQRQLTRSYFKRLKAIWPLLGDCPVLHNIAGMASASSVPTNA